MIAYANITHPSLTEEDKDTLLTAEHWLEFVVPTSRDPGGDCAAILGESRPYLSVEGRRILDDMVALSLQRFGQQMGTV